MTATLTLDCTGSPVFAISLSNGVSPGATVTNRSMSGGGSNRLNYGLFSDPGYTQNWGNTPGTGLGDRYFKRNHSALHHLCPASGESVRTAEHVRRYHHRCDNPAIRNQLRPRSHKIHSLRCDLESLFAFCDGLGFRQVFWLADRRRINDFGELHKHYTLQCGAECRNSSRSDCH